MFLYEFTTVFKIVTLSLSDSSSSADPGFLKKGFKCRKGRFISHIVHKIS